MGGQEERRALRDAAGEGRRGDGAREGRGD